MKLFKYDKFINESKSKEDIDSICQKYKIKNYTINDGLVDVDGDVVLYSYRLTKLPLKFGKVTGSFDCRDNNLTSLEGCPYEVGGSFYCSINRLTSLEGSPQITGGSFNCRANNLTSLVGGPEKVYFDFNCSNNQLTSLEGSPKEVGFDFFCYNNRLTSLLGGPEKVGNTYTCSDNNISDVKGFPLNIGDNLYIVNNPVHEIFRLFPYVEFQEVAEYLNEYNVIRDGKKVVLQALELVYDELGLEVPENIKIEGYKII